MNMLNIKPMAALSSGLLARKGQARPAMRRPVLGGEPAEVIAALPSAPQAADQAAIEDDLGWNDMGVPPVPAIPAPAAPERRPADAAALPPVLETLERLETALAPVARAASGGRKAAFTLRLDSERHLRLRLASAVRGRSAQQRVTEALDALLATMPEIDGLRERLSADTPVRER